MADGSMRQRISKASSLADVILINRLGGGKRRLTYMTSGQPNRSFTIVSGQWDVSTVDALIAFWPDERLTRPQLAEALGFLMPDNRPSPSKIASKVDELVSAGRLQNRNDSAKILSGKPSPRTKQISVGKQTLDPLASFAGIDVTLPPLITRAAPSSSALLTKKTHRTAGSQASSTPRSEATESIPIAKLIDANDVRFEKDGVFCTHTEKPGKIWLRCSAVVTGRTSYCTVHRPLSADSNTSDHEFVFKRWTQG